jgi:hypothetical protein
MKVQTVRVSPDSAAGEHDAPQNSEVVMLKITGPLDDSNPVMIRARELVNSTGSEVMIRSFDDAVSTGAIFIRA